MRPTLVGGPVLPAADSSLAAGRVGRLERLPKWLNLVPLVAQWAWLSIRHGSITLPSCANPCITAGGLVGEGKMEYLRIMGTQALGATATTTCVVAAGAESVADAEAAMARARLSYPIVVKPDLGWCGFGVRRVDDGAAMRDYLAAFPRGERVVIQQWVADSGEAGIFYMRGPGDACGQVIGMVLRHYPRVVGDGVHSVADLIAADPRARRLGRDGASEPCCDVCQVPAAGQAVRIATVGSTRVGGMYASGHALITAELTRAIDAIAKDMTEFHVGRFDVKYASAACLRAGEFTIIEVNGAGSEAVHAWDPSLTLTQAYGIIFRKQRRLFAIGESMRRLGHRPVGWLALARHHLRQQALISRYPPSN
ncbi:MAG: hypothetical protein H7Y33_19370 [Cytophagales bacterium]|nr:hypothetical protein [Rhizobacter sp.]